jgi:hypothetical protein
MHFDLRECAIIVAGRARHQTDRAVIGIDPYTLGLARSAILSFYGQNVCGLPVVLMAGVFPGGNIQMKTDGYGNSYPCP